MNRHRLLFGLCLILLVLAATPPPTAAADCQDWVARTVSVQGRVETRRAGESQWLPVKIGAAHCLGDAVRLGTLSRAAIVLREGGVVRLDQNTTITFTPPPERAGTWLDVLTGTAHFFTRAPRRLRITTPFVNGSVEGTEFLIEVEVAEARISVWEGRVLAENAQGSLALGARAVGSRARRAAPDAPADHRDGPPTPSPGLSTIRPSSTFVPTTSLTVPGETWPADVRRSIAAAQAGRPRRGASRASRPFRIPSPDPGCPPTGPASSSRWDEWTRPDLDDRRGARTDPGNATLSPSESIVAVTQNERADGRPTRRARRSQARSRHRSPLYFALVLRPAGDFDLDAAPARAWRLRSSPDPSSALAHARLAELWLAARQPRPRARRGRAEAVRLDAGLGRSARRSRLRPPRAPGDRDARPPRPSSARSRSIRRHPCRGSASASPRSARGDLEEGRQELEIAVSLDPGDSLLRSYLGKAYYEERQPVLAADQFELAEELDPQRSDALVLRRHPAAEHQPARSRRSSRSSAPSS